jgi:hypothetical protein
MKTTFLYTLFFVALFFASCKEQADKPKVIYEDAKVLAPPIKRDSTEIKIADLPIHRRCAFV